MKSKTYRRADERPATGYSIPLCGKRLYGTRTEAVAAAQDVSGQLLLGASREDAERHALNRLTARRRARKWFSGG
jgi:hypothetical protein